MSPGSSGIAMGRASGEVMQKGAVRVMAKGGRWKDPAGDERDGLWRSGHGPSGQRPQRRKAEGSRLKEYTGFSLTGRKLSERVSTRTPYKVRDHGRELVTKGMVETRADFSGEPPVE